MANPRPLPIPVYADNVPSMENYTWRTERGFKYDLNEGYITAAVDILDWMFPKFAEFEGYQLNRDDLLDFSDIEVNDVVWENSGPVAYIVTGLVLMFIMIFAGIGWCVVKYCCCCLRNRNEDDDVSMVSNDFENKREKFARISCGVGLGIWIFCFSFGLWGCFVANEQVQNAVSGLMKDIDKSLYDTQQYIDVTRDQINSVFNQSYDDFGRAYLQSWGYSGNLQNVKTFSENLDANAIRYELNAASKAATQLSKKFQTIDESVEESKEQIQKIFATCTTGFCKQIVQNGVSNLKVAGSFENLKMVLGSEISKSLNEGIEIAAKLKISPRDEYEEKLKRLINEVGNGEGGLKQDAKLLTDAMGEIPVDKTRKDIEEVDEEMQNWIPYMYAAGLITCIVLLLIPIILALGAFLGCFGSRSRKSFLARRRGGIFMNCGVLSMFITAWILWILALAAFTFSGLLSQVVCEALRDLENNKTVTTTTTTRSFPFAAANGPSPRAYELPKYADIVQRCKSKESAYNTFALSTAHNIDEIFETMELFPKEINQFVEKKAKSFFGDVNSLESKLSSVSTNLKAFKNSMGENILDLVELQGLATHPDAIHTKDKLNLEISKLDDLNKRNIDLVKSEVKLLDDHIHTALSLVSKVTKNYQDETERIQIVLAEGGPAEQVQAYFLFVYEYISEHVGDCEPLYIALDSAIDLFCYKIASPVAAFWFSLQILLLLFIPLIITAILLDKLYRRR